MTCKIVSWDPTHGQESAREVDNLEMALKSVCANIGGRNDTVRRIECDDGTNMHREAIEQECRRRK